MIQVYTGGGRGKTTAALGLALRAAGAGFKVYIGQFIKRGCYSELRSLRSIRNIKIEQFGRGCFIKNKPTLKDISLAREGLKRVDRAIRSNKYRVIILDEINIAIKLKLLSLKEMVSFIKKVPARTELILTGRNADKKIIKMAHLVSEIKEIKHYFKNGIKARRGFDF